MLPIVLAEGLQFPEGPVWASTGVLYVTEMGTACITAIDPDGLKTNFAYTGGSPNGAAFGPGGYLYVANSGGRGPGYIQRIDHNGNVEILYDACDGEPFQGPNDLVFDGHGGFYFTDPGPVSREGVKFGHVYYALADGSMVRRQPYYFCLPNGIALTADNAMLIVLESLTGRVWGIPIESPGKLAEMDAGVPRRQPIDCPDATLLTSIPGLFQPDGMCIDSQGRLLICAHNGGFVSIHDAEGCPVARLEVEDKQLTNCCFGGQDLSTLYITESGFGRVVVVEWESQGLQLNDHA